MTLRRGSLLVKVHSWKITNDAVQRDMEEKKNVKKIRFDHRALTRT